MIMNISALAVIVVVLALIVKAAAAPVHTLRDQNQMRSNESNGYYNEADTLGRRDEGRSTIIIILLALLLLALIPK